MATKEENYYRNLSEVYQLNYNDMIEVAEALMTIQGISVSMYSDLIAFAQKNGKNATYNKAERRLKLLMKNICILSDIQSANYALRLANRRLVSQVQLLENELREQHRQDALIFKFENDFNLPIKGDL